MDKNHFYKEADSKFNHNLCRGNFVKPDFPEPGKEIGGQVAAVPGYCLGFQDIALRGPPRKVGSAPGKHVPGKFAYGYAPGPGVPGAALPLFPFEPGDQGHGAGFRIGFRPGAAVRGEFCRVDR
jgi:hypothetical protein